MRRNDVMTSEVEERPRFFMGGYGWHRSQWVKAILLVLILCLCVTTVRLSITADSKIQSSIDKCAFHCSQSNVWRLLAASNYCQVRGNQIVVHSSDNETVLGSSPKLEGPAKHLIDSNKKCICQLTFHF